MNEQPDYDGCPQIIFYQAGVGSVGNILQHITGGALGNGLGDNILEAYSYIAINYQAGDEIFLLGFSRGAYTARAVGGFMADMGLLTRDGLNYFYYVFSDWQNAGRKGYKPLLPASNPEFRIKAPASDISAYLKEYSEELTRLGLTTPNVVAIKAVGVFETVGALGIPFTPFLQRLGFPEALRPYRFFDTRLGPNVENAFQALALDERRSTYGPTVWEKGQDQIVNLKQVWFPGAHDGIGGGYADDGLANISLAWMMSQLAPWIDFYPDYIKKQQAANQAYLAKENAPVAGRLWAKTRLVDTAKGIRALLGVTDRTPGRYYRLDRKTDRVEKGQPLTNTHEHIHVAARSRHITGGLDTDDKLKEYDSTGLVGYEVLNADAEPGEAGYKYTGKDEPFRGKILPEDELGVYEKEIYQNYVSRKGGSDTSS